MQVDQTVSYRDSSDGTVFSIDAVKFASAHPELRLHVIKTMIVENELASDSAPYPQLFVKQPAKIYRSVPMGGYSMSGRLSVWRSGPPPVHRKPFEIKINLGIFPSDSFRYSQDMSCAEIRPSEAASSGSRAHDSNINVSSRMNPQMQSGGSSAASVPSFNLILSNMTLLKHSSTAQNFVAASGLYTSQSPSQSFFTCFYGSAMDQYFQIVRNGYP
ncbi:Hypothetical protein NTJ_01646 [Nesidiocoris tenuis]|uniref:Uncharacterized protein n=1 Tax=Nesidiocoris tenuis TaxID=355587 RepID=A0ABN7A952_9HEMI|nr:Hypothetical protein NTJ_01646 [Nesidiocoris tenuis]